MSKSTEFMITFKVKPDSLMQFKSVLESVKRDLPNVKGCNGVSIYIHADTTQNQFTLLESWESQGAHQAHVAHLQKSGDWATIEEMLASDPDGYYLNSL